ncbi:PREDICTED: ACT domain-containing protein ACR1-like [Camelina sativa]|uniref:ACT domain-containing protein ACR n=1 Tax=Camelina sativa TaxID=90675 RepID=A0ABM1R8V5_CAMSA|nr:PREDICTED: ACT domain-containing protein ACR1-like [Camelina sativa]XP_019095442.1 PREDICTED: ACT domain-containing protein ACR1-like [Camelina sativa]XP_019095443.1 PREDICTED: ACT domain-containing protein ACR1-like [Camelina sativa]
MMEIAYQPRIDSEIESLVERINPPRVCVDNDSDPECTLVKVDSANKYGILLDVVQVLADLDLVISKSYISSDGEWFMDVFHVTDQLGNKLTDRSLILYIQQAICSSRTGGITKEMQSHLKREVQQRHVCTEHTAFEITGINRPGLLSEISAVLSDIGCHVTAAVAWTHHERAAMVIYLDDGFNGGPIIDPIRKAQVKDHLDTVMEAHHIVGDESRVVVRIVEAKGAPVEWDHTERRLHELMYAEGDYENCSDCDCFSGDRCDALWRGRCERIHVAIEACNGYSMVNVKCRDRPKLLFDTVCALKELQFVVFHAVAGAKGSTAEQEYFIRKKNGCTLETEVQRERLRHCLVAAISRRASRGLKLEIRTENKMGLLSDVTRVVRENGLSITRAEMSTQGDIAVGSFYVTDVNGGETDPNAVEAVVRELGGAVVSAVKAVGMMPMRMGSTSDNSVELRDKTKSSIGRMFWSKLERLSSSIKSL